MEVPVTHEPAEAVSSAILALDGIHFRRSGRNILTGVSWRIEPGQHWALLGANGSGKTTLLKIVTGYEWPTEGKVEVLGHRFGECNLPRLRRIIGWVSSSLQERVPPQDTALRVVASGYDASLGLYRDLDADEERHARSALALVSAEELADRPYGILSQGERQRVLIARALVNRPRLLILDEPCVGLDPLARWLFLEDLRGLARRTEAPGIVFVTHHIEEIGPWIDRVLLLKAGRVCAIGSKDEVLADGPLSEALGARCRVERDNGAYRLRLAPSEPA